MARTYAIRTFGCQMNEHDSERIAGLLEGDGYQRASVLEDADVMVLNTCCIRENADNKLYGALARLKAVKAKRPDALIAVAGCLAQKDRELVRERAGHVDVVFGTTTCTGPPSSSTTPGGTGRWWRSWPRRSGRKPMRLRRQLPPRSTTVQATAPAQPPDSPEPWGTADTGRGSCAQGAERHPAG